MTVCSRLVLAALSIAFTGVPLAAQAQQQNSQPGTGGLGLVLMGDAITKGTGMAEGKGYAVQLASQLGVAEPLNLAQNGAMAEDLTRNQASTYSPPETDDKTGPSSAYGVMVGTVNALRNPTSTDWITQYKLTLRAALTWIGLPGASHMDGQSSKVEDNGSWSADEAISDMGAVSSSTQDSSVTFPIKTSGGPLYLAYRMFYKGGGTASVTVDGNQVDTIEASGVGSAEMLTQNKTADSLGVARYPVPAGDHRLTVTVTSATAANNLVSVVWAGTPVREAGPMPAVFVGGVIRQKDDANAVGTAAYDKAVRELVNELAADGLRVQYVDTRAAMKADASDMVDLVHPNEAGHAELARAFSQAMLPLYRKP